MRALRIMFALLGAAGLGYGALLAIQVLTNSTADGIASASWLVGGPLAHDIVLAPVMGVLAVLLGRRFGPGWRAPIAIGAVVSGTLLLLSVPALWRTYAGQANPGLDHRDYRTGLLIWLAAVWLVVLVVGFVRTRAHTTEGPHTDR